MPVARKQSTPKCPKCGGPVYRGSNRNERGSKSGEIRYQHRMPLRKTCGWNGTQPVGVADDKAKGVDKHQSAALKKVVEASNRKTYVITSAQNATPPFAQGWKSLQTYVKHVGAQLLVIPYRYKNPTSIWSEKAKSDDWWHPDFTPFIINHRVDLNDHLILLADIMTQPTATRPLEGFETMTGGQSAIVGHPKLELMTVPTPQEKLPKLLTTTGAITRKNYIPSKAGKKGEHHHTYGAIVVEIEDDLFCVRQLNMRGDGSFCDLLNTYDGDEVKPYDRVPALVMGDTHVEVVDAGVVRATFTAEDSIVKTLRPEVLVWHDLHDGTSQNHHDRGRAFHEFVKHRSGRRSVEAELRRTFQFVDEHTPADTRNVIVASNHHDFVKEWVENTDPRRDPENFEFWVESARAILKSKETQWTPAGVAVQDAFSFWGERMLERCGGRTTFLRRDQAYQIKGIEVGYHGDKGPGGSKGSLWGFRKIGVKSVIGHGHAPGIMDGAYQVGTSSRLDLTYAAGTPSGWLHTHCVIYPNGKRTLINIIDGRWRATPSRAQEAA